MRRVQKVGLGLRLGLGMGAGDLTVINPLTVRWTGLGATNDWSEAANWEGGFLPREEDEVLFDSSGVKDCTIDPVAALPVQEICVSAGYTGTITQQRDITVETTLCLNGGAFDTAGFDITAKDFELYGGAFLANSSTLDIERHVLLPETGGLATFDAGTSTIRQQEGRLRNGDVNNAFHQYETGAGALIRIVGDVYLSQTPAGGASFGANTDLRPYTGDFTVSMPLAPVIFDTRFCLGCYSHNLLTAVFGDFAAGAAQDIVFDVGVGNVLGFNDITMAPTTGIQAINFGSADSVLSARGDVDLGAALAVSGLGWFDFVGGSDQTLVSDQTYITKVRVNKTAGTAVFATAVDVTRFLVLGGVADLNGFDLVTEDFLVSGGSIALEDAGSVTAVSLAMSGGQIGFPAIGSADLIATGNVSITGGSFTNPANGLLLINGSAHQDLTATGVTLPNVEVAGTWSNGRVFHLSTLTVAGEYKVSVGEGGSNTSMVCMGGFDMDCGTFTIPNNAGGALAQQGATITCDNWFVGSGAHKMDGTIRVTQRSGTLRVDAGTDRIDIYRILAGETVQAIGSVNLQDVTLEDGALLTDNGLNRTINLSGGITFGTGAKVEGTALNRLTLQFSSAFSSNVTDFWNVALRVLGSSSVTQQQDMSTLGNFLVDAAFRTNGHDLSVLDITIGPPGTSHTGDFSLETGSVVQARNIAFGAGNESTNAFRFQGGEIRLTGNFTARTLTPIESTAGKLTLNGTTAQTVALKGKTVPNIEVTNADAAVTFTEAFTTGDFICETPGASLLFQGQTLDYGAGTALDPWKIYFIWDLLRIGSGDTFAGGTWDDTDHYQVMNDLDLSGLVIDRLPRLEGTFDGQNFTIRNLNLVNTTDSNVGLFTATGGAAVIKNVRLTSAYVEGTGGDDTAILVGVNNGLIEDCFIEGSANGGSGGGSNYVAGVVGENNGTIRHCQVEFTSLNTFARRAGGIVGDNIGTIEDCSVVANLSGIQAGGFVGWMNGGVVRRCYAYTTVVPFSNGGGIGRMIDGTIEDCYTEGIISSSGPAGGLIADLWGGTVRRCFSAAVLTNSGSDIGGLIGVIQEDAVFTIENCYWDTEVSGQASSAGPEVGKTTAEMQDINTFLPEWEIEPLATWTTEVWAIDAASYPSLGWTHVATPALPVSVLPICFTIGNLTINGAVGDLISIDRNGGSGTDQFFFCVLAAQEVSLVSLANNYISILSSAVDSTDGGNNTNWNFVSSITLLGDPLTIDGEPVHFDY